MELIKRTGSTKNEVIELGSLSILIKCICVTDLLLIWPYMDKEASVRPTLLSDLPFHWLVTLSRDPEKLSRAPFKVILVPNIKGSS